MYLDVFFIKDPIRCEQLNFREHAQFTVENAGFERPRIFLEGGVASAYNLAKSFRKIRMKTPLRILVVCFF